MLSRVMDSFRSLYVRRASHVGWRNYVIGAGLAFDPLPAVRSRFARDDRAALAADLMQLVSDRDAVLKNGIPAEAKALADGGAATRFTRKRVDAKIRRLREKAG